MTSTELQVVLPEHVSFKGGTTIALINGTHAHVDPNPSEERSHNGAHLAKLHRECDGATVEVLVKPEVMEMRDGLHRQMEVMPKRI